jgi:hypothetical protein
MLRKPQMSGRSISSQTHYAWIERTRCTSKWALYKVTFQGEVLCEDTTDPELEGCRALLARGISGRVQFQLVGCAPGLSMDIVKGAKLCAVETDSKSAHFAKWQPFPGKKLQKEEEGPEEKAAA